MVTRLVINDNKVEGVVNISSFHRFFFKPTFIVIVSSVISSVDY